MLAVGEHGIRCFHKRYQILDKDLTEGHAGTDFRLSAVASLRARGHGQARWHDDDHWCQLMRCMADMLPSIHEGKMSSYRFFLRSEMEGGNSAPPCDSFNHCGSHRFLANAPTSAEK
jgi:hypothetical protein